MEKQLTDNFRLKECGRSYVAHVQNDDGPIDSNQEKARLTKAQADKTEIEVAAMRGEGQEDKKIMSTHGWIGNGRTNYQADQLFFGHPVAKDNGDNHCHNNNHGFSN